MDNIKIDGYEILRLVMARHLAIAAHPDYEIAGYDKPTYRNSRLLALCAIKAAYPEHDAGELYECWVDSQEDIGMYVEYFDRHGEYPL